MLLDHAVSGVTFQACDKSWIHVHTHVTTNSCVCLDTCSLACLSATSLWLLGMLPTAS